METLVRGNAFVYGANIDTDQIYPGRFLDLTEDQDLALHAMEGADPEFVKNFKRGDIIVASTNFGCGSSREHAATALKAAGVGAIVAKSFARIFYRNAINLGILAVVCHDLKAERGDLLCIDLGASTLTNTRDGLTYAIEPISDYAMEILEAGGIKNLLNKRMNL